jgi:hypothetical protein
MKMSLPIAVILTASTCALSIPAVAQTTHANKSRVVYVAHLHAINSKITGSHAGGEAQFIIRGDRLTIIVKAHGVPPDMLHLQHLHGFKDGRAASCATQAADVNHDGIVDLIETEPASGITMVPLTTDPVNMKIMTNTYPTASANGSYHYLKNISLKALQAAFTKTFDGQKLDLDHLVVFIHGVPATTKLPASVASLAGVPAQATLPIACGRIERLTK